MKAAILHIARACLALSDMHMWQAYRASISGKHIGHATSESCTRSVLAVVAQSVCRSKVGHIVRSAVSQCLYVFRCDIRFAIESKSTDTTRLSVVPSKVDYCLTIADVVRITIVRINRFVWQ
jgi:hypothetical protein